MEGHVHNDIWKLGRLKVTFLGRRCSQQLRVLLLNVTFNPKTRMLEKIGVVKSGSGIRNGEGMGKQ
jgi:hypothetical protein